MCVQGIIEMEDEWLRSAVGALAPRHAALFTVLRALVQARTMGQHREALGHFSRTVMWDVPPILMRDREQMRVAVYLAKFAATMDFKAVILGVGPHQVEDQGTGPVMLMYIGIAGCTCQTLRQSSLSQRSNPGCYIQAIQNTLHSSLSQT